MAGLCCDRRLLRKTHDGDESYELWVELDKDSLVIGEDCQGPLTEAVFGEVWHRSMVRLDAGWAGFEVLCPESDAPLRDLMDLLDAKAVPYSYLGLGSSGVVTLRHSPVQSAA